VHGKAGSQKVVSLLGLQPQTLLQSVLDNVSVALAVIDPERKFVFTNRAAFNMFGAAENLSVAEWRRHYRVHDSHGREILPGQSPILRAFEGESVEPHEVRVTLPDGHMKWLHVAGHPFSVMGLNGVFLVVTDETEQIELRKALERAEHIEEIGILAGGLAHDLNNIFSLLSDNLALALSEKGGQQDPSIRLEQMATAVRAGAALVGRLMQHSRTQDTQVRSLQINDVVSAAIELARPLFRNRLRVKIDMSESLPPVRADFTRLEHVLVNLLLNAVDAMPEAGELALSTKLVSDDAVPERKNDSEKDFVLISVTDTGIGIPENIRHRIFEPFFTTKPSGKGTGLGLSSARAIVGQCNGHIDVHSTPGMGTTFNIYLPVEESSALAAK
jgi:two-component system, cell cycle sensor histidine kinase and response regulator CckA